MTAMIRRESLAPGKRRESLLPPDEGRRMSKVQVQHRSDMLMQEQIGQVQQVQSAILESLDELSRARSGYEINSLRVKMEHLQQQAEEKLLMLQIVRKINVELVYARDELQRALKNGGDVNRARKRVGWLEDRMENLLGRRRVRSPARSFITEEIIPQTPMTPLMTADTNKRDTCAQGDILIGPPSTVPDEAEDSSSGDFSSPVKEESASNENKTIHANSDDVVPNVGDGDSPRVISIEAHVTEAKDDHSNVAPNNLPEQNLLRVNIQINIQPASSIGDQSDRDLDSLQDVSEAGEMQDTGDDIRTKAASSEDALTLAETVDAASEDSDEETASISKSVATRQSKTSRVTVKTPSEMDELLAVTAESHTPAVSEYWNSEHHRFEYSEFKDSLLRLNPLSYHQMGLAVPGSFVGSENYDAKLPWRPQTKSEITDVHKVALDKLAQRLQKFHEKLCEASALSTGTQPSCSKPNFEDLSLKERPVSLSHQPTMAKYIELTRPASEQSVSFPPLMKERLGSSLSGRLIYYPNPLPYPDKLPLTRTKKSKVYPKSSENYSKSVPGKTGPAERIVDQRNLYNETKFTSSLYRSNPARRSSPSTSQKHFQRLLIQDESKSSSAVSEKRRPGLKGTVNAVTGVLKFKEETEPTILQMIRNASAQDESEWSLMKPKTGALEHTGLKWERVKSIVHDNLISPHVDERADAAKHLGMLQCGDTLVMYALKERLKHDEEDKVRYEAGKALVLLGCWEEVVVEAMLFYLINGNRNMRIDILKTMISGKNVQYIDKGLKSFPDLMETLSILCINDEAEDQLSLNAAVLLGKLCVHDKNAINKMRQVLKDSKNTHTTSQAVDSLVRQFACHEWDVVEAVLRQVVSSPVWKHRLNAAKLLIVMGKTNVCIEAHQEFVYDLLEKRLWDDPNKNVRLEVAKAMAALELFAQACEQAEKRLEDPSEDIRAQAVITLGTLGMKTERIIKSLLEMLDLDSSEFVRLMILRTIAQLNCQDKRVVRVLRDKERGEGTLALEARKTMDVLGIKTLPSITSKIVHNKQFTSAISFSMLAGKT